MKTTPKNATQHACHFSREVACFSRSDNRARSKNWREKKTQERLERGSSLALAPLSPRFLRVRFNPNTAFYYLNAWNRLRGKRRQVPRIGITWCVLCCSSLAWYMLYPGIGIITPARPFPTVIPVEIIPIMTCVAKETIIFSVTIR